MAEDDKDNPVKAFLSLQILLGELYQKAYSNGYRDGGIQEKVKKN